MTTQSLLTVIVPISIYSNYIEIVKDNKLIFTKPISSSLISDKPATPSNKDLIYIYIHFRTLAEKSVLMLLSYL